MRAASRLTDRGDRHDRERSETRDRSDRGDRRGRNGRDSRSDRGDRRARNGHEDAEPSSKFSFRSRHPRSPSPQESRQRRRRTPPTSAEPARRRSGSASPEEPRQRRRQSSPRDVELPRHQSRSPSPQDLPQRRRRTPSKDAELPAQPSRSASPQEPRQRSRRTPSGGAEVFRRRSRSASPKEAQQKRRQTPPRDIEPPRHRPAEQTDHNSRAASQSELSPKSSVARMQEAEAALEIKEQEKEKPSLEYSGRLAAETNKVKGVTLLFTEPPEARSPTTRWRLYVFKDGEPLKEPLYIHRQSCYLFGRERRVADVPTDHPSCSKQHAVIQYRLTEKEKPDGMMGSKIRPYLMDLGSTNGTFLNGNRIDSQRYYELMEKDTIKFGNSSREYVVLHEHSAG